MKKRACHGLWVAGLVVLAMGRSFANPQGGQVASGSATINTVPGTVTINQQSNTAIINWQSFSINSGELTQFIQPSATSAALNRVLGGQTSVINGTLSANGQVYLINGNGILVGPGGVVNTGGFTASTRDIADSDFLSGNLHFTGSNNAGVQNLGTINAIGGNIVLIGKTADNQGSITAPNGTVGLAAGDDVLLAQKNSDGSTIMVSPTTTATSASSQVGVHNSGTITAANAELKAANGNIYALAVQNEGIVRATTVQKQGGHIWLTSDSGTVVNSGTLDASATAAKGQGGTVTIKSTTGTAVHSGTILAKGGQGGAGGSADISAPMVQITGNANLTAPGGTTGNFTIDPATLTVITGGTLDGGSFTLGGGDPPFYFNPADPGANDTIDPTVLEGLLANASVTLNADTNITISSALSWTSMFGSTILTLSTNTPGSTLKINAPITPGQGNGGLVIQMAAPTDLISISSAGAINVDSFILQSGKWVQNGAVLPAFTSEDDFEVQGSSTFIRALGGDGSTGNPYQITDVYGLQGLTSINNNGMPASAVLVNDIDAVSTGIWNGESGFVPIGNATIPYTGTFNGQSHVIDQLAVSDANNAGLFGVSLGTIENVGLTNEVVQFQDAGNSGTAGGVVGLNAKMGALTGTVLNCYVSSDPFIGGIDGNFSTDGTSSSTGGLVGENDGLIQNSYNYNVTVEQMGGGSNTGGLVGVNKGAIQNSFSTGGIGFDTLFDDTEIVTNVGGLVGDNEGTITGSYSTGLVNAETTGNSTTNGTDVGGLAGLNNGLVQMSYSTSTVESGSLGINTGGLVGENAGTIQVTYSTGAVSGSPPPTPPPPPYPPVGGLVGLNDPSGVVLNSYWNTDANGSLSPSGVGNNNGTLTNVQGETMAQLQTQATFQPTGTGVPNWDFTAGTGDWIMIDGQTTPLLQKLSSTISGTAFSDTGATPVGDDPVDLLSNGAVVATTMSSTTTVGAYSFLIPADQAVGGVLLVDPTAGSNTYYSSGATINPVVTGIELWSNTLRVVGTGEATNTALALAGGTQSGVLFTSQVDPGSNGQDLDIAAGNVEIDSPFKFDANIQVDNGTFVTTASAPLTVFADGFGGPVPVNVNTANDITLGAPVYSTGSLVLNSSSGNINLSGAISGPGNVTLTAALNITDTASVNIGSFILQGGFWAQLVEDSSNVGTGNIVGSLPAFSVGNDFELQGGTFLRAAGGNGATAPYQLTDIYGIQGLGSPTENLFNANAELINNIDATGTATWNQGTGFRSIGDSDLAYGGTFNGQNFAIDGLFINQPTTPAQLGLFGISSGTLEKVMLTNVNITAMDAGGLVGINTPMGTVENSSVSGTMVQMGDSIGMGGLVGVNEGDVTSSSSTVTITGHIQLGGLVGENETGAIIVGSSSSGTVMGPVDGSGGTALGGLVGENDGTIQDSFSNGTVLGGSSAGDIGGLVGTNNTLVMDSYSSASVSGFEIVGGLVGENNGGAKVMDSYSTGPVTGLPNGDSIGGIVGENDGLLETSYSTGLVTSDVTTTNVGGLIGSNPTGAVTNAFWATDSSGQNTSAGGIPTIAVELADPQFYVDQGVTGTTEGFWNFNIGGAWAVNATGSTGLLNGGLPVLQTFDPLTAVVQADDQFVDYGAVVGTLTFTVLDGSLAGALTSGPTLAISGTNVNAGTTNTITITGTPVAGTVVEFLDGTEQIDRATITVVATTTPVTKVYDGTDTATLNTINYTLQGFVGSDGGTVTTGAGFYDTKDTSATTATFNGPTLTVTSGLMSNYMIDDQIVLPGVITPAPLTITGAGVNNKPYDTTTTATLSSFGTVTGFGTDDVTLASTGLTANFITKNAANNIPVIVTGYTLVGADKDDYTVTQPTGLTANITPAVVTISSSAPVTKVYDSTTTANPSSLTTANYTLNGIFSPDAATLTTTGGNYNSPDVPTATTVTFNGLGLNFTSGLSTNYTLNSVTSVALPGSITPATITIASNATVTRVYDGTTTANPSLLTAANYTLNGLLSPDNATLTTTGGTYNSPNVVGTTTVTFNGLGFSFTSGLAADYSLASTNVVLPGSITPATITIASNATVTRNYDGTTTADPSLLTTANYTLNGLFSTDNATLTTTGGTYNSPNVAGATTATFNGLGLSFSSGQGSNYTLNGTTSVVLPGQIFPATITVVAGAPATKVYDGSVTALPASLTSANYTLNGLFGSDNATLTTTGGFYDSKDVNATTATMNGIGLAFTSGLMSNYVVTDQVVLPGSITPAALTVTGAAANNKPYDGTTTATLSNFGALNGVIGSDDVTLNTAGSSANFATVNASNNIPVTVTGYALGGGDAGDYTVTSPTGLVANITPATITIASAAPVTKVYDGTNAATLIASNYTLNGFVGTDSATLTTTGGVYDTPNVPATTATFNGLGLSFGAGLSSNYALSTTTVALPGVIAPAPLTITANDAGKTFDGTAFSGGNGVSYSGFVNSEGPSVLGGNLVYTGTSQGAVNVGNYSIIPGGLTSGNYALSFNSGLLSITPASVPGVTITPQGAALIATVLAGITDLPDPAITDVGLTIPDLGGDIVFEDLDGGAIFDGGGDPNAYIAFGSSTSGGPAFYRLLTAGSGPGLIVNGIVSLGQPPANIVQDFEGIFSGGTQNDLQLAALSNYLFGGTAGSGAPGYVLLLTPGGGIVVIANGAVGSGSTPATVQQEFDAIFNAELQDQLHNAAFGSH